MTPDRPDPFDPAPRRDPTPSSRGPAGERGVTARYGRYAGGPDPLAPPVDLAEALAAIGEDVMAGAAPDRALREFLRRGAAGRPGLDDLAGRAARRRRELSARHRLDGTLQEVKELLDRAVLAERKQLARDLDDDARFAEMRLDNLPPSTAGAVRELADYPWRSSEARDAYEQIRQALGAEVLEQRFEGMKQALQGASEEDRQRVTEMVKDLGDLLDAHARGEDVTEQFGQFMDKHGEFFPENPQNIDELVDALARRSAAAQRMWNSMTPEQRAELSELTQQAFGSPELAEALSRLDSSLRALRPGEDWDSAQRFEGQEGLGLGEGVAVLAEMGELDELSEQLSQSYAGAALDDIDLELLGKHLGEDAVVSAQTLAQLERELRESGYLQRRTDGSWRLSPAAMRRLGKDLLKDAAQRLSDRSGQRDARLAGAAGEATGSSRPWQFGDSEPWEVTRTVGNAVARMAAAGDDPRAGVRLAIGDVEVAETEARTEAAVALLVDVSFSMAIEGRWVPMKRTALTLHHLVTSRFRGDRLQLITFGRYARATDVDELTGLEAHYDQGTNLHHGLLLAARHFREHRGMQPVLLVVTDGEPTAHLDVGGESLFYYPPRPETLQLTVDALDALGRLGAQVTFFRLGDHPGLERFVAAMARRVDGKVVAPDLDDLGAAVVGSYLRAHTGPSVRDAFW